MKNPIVFFAIGSIVQIEETNHILLKVDPIRFDHPAVWSDIRLGKSNCNRWCDSGNKFLLLNIYGKFKSLPPVFRSYSFQSYLSHLLITADPKIDNLSYSLCSSTLLPVSLAPTSVKYFIPLHRELLPQPDRRWIFESAGWRSLRGEKRGSRSSRSEPSGRSGYEGVWSGHQHSCIRCD